MKFQNCILINFVTDTRTDKPNAICSFNFSKAWGITRTDVYKYYAPSPLLVKKGS